MTAGNAGNRAAAKVCRKKSPECCLVATDGIVDICIETFGSFTSSVPGTPRCMKLRAFPDSASDA
eukprot:8355909-Lingulodinium_polyedra.AAC.1